MSLQFSIIIPCFNCVNTLREAVLSCYTQNLNKVNFEIIMVDDGSSDGTRVLMEQLASEYANIKLVFHPKNRGGGAARNTGIQTSSGRIIYCLDSDNVFAPHSVPAMLAYLDETGADGVAFFERRFFFGQNLRNFTTHINTILDRSITLLDIFNESNTLLDNFFYTRASYDTTLGYPEHHGFDTQCFELRYLSAGNTVRVVPESIFYHRQGTNEPSYFERVHNSGLFSVNMMLIFEDIFHLFTPAVQEELVDFPLFTNNRSNKINISTFLKNKVRGGEAVFTKDYTTYLAPNGRALWLESNQNDKGLTSIFSALERIDDTAALKLFGDYLKQRRQNSPYLIFLSLRLIHLLSGGARADQVRQALRDGERIKVFPLGQPGGTLWRTIRKKPLTQKIIQLLRRPSSL